MVMRILLIVLFYCFLSIACKAQADTSKIDSDHIRIDHFGQIDKPFIPLIISAQHLNLSSDELEVFIGERVYSTVLTSIRESKYIGLEREVNEFGVFRIWVFVSGKRTVYFLPTRVKSISFFKELKKKTSNQTGSEKLIKEIDYILSRIDWPKKE
jgi:hypothetical protein